MDFQVMREHDIRQMAATMDKDELTSCIVAMNSFIFMALNAGKKVKECGGDPTSVIAELKGKMNIYPKSVQTIMKGFSLNMLMSLLTSEFMEGGD